VMDGVSWTMTLGLIKGVNEGFFIEGHEHEP